MCNPMHLFVMFFLLHAVLWLHISKFMLLLAAELVSTKTFYSLNGVSGTISPTLYSIVWERTNAFLLAEVARSHFVSLFFFFLSILIGWYGGAGVFGLIGCNSLSPKFSMLLQIDKW